MSTKLKTAGFAGSNGGGDFFKPKEHMNHVAVLIEPQNHRVVPNKKFGGDDDYVDCDVTLFPTGGHLTGAEDPIVLTNVTIPGGTLAKNMKEEIGSACFGKLVGKASNYGNTFVVLDPIGDVAAVEAVTKYIDKREAERNAEVPEWLR